MKQTFVPREKMGKKARRQLDAAKRACWSVSPVTKTIESKKKYDRKKASRELRKEWSPRDAFLYAFAAGRSKHSAAE